MTTVYFIRHAEADNTNHDGRNRPLTEKGWFDRRLVTEYLQDKNIDVVLSSPYKRAIDTIVDFADKNGLRVKLIEDFREHEVGAWRQSNEGSWITDFDDFIGVCKKQWSDFSYRYPNGESLAQLQERNIAALNDVLVRYKGKTIAIGTHGAALSSIINYYDTTYGFEDFMAMIDITPWVVKMEFNDNGLIEMKKINLFYPNQVSDINKHKVCIYDFGVLLNYKFVVIFARFQDKWLYCRAKERDTFETAGGHIEKGETPIEAAKRELHEETGAVSFDIAPAFDYSVSSSVSYTNGQVFLAEVHELGDMPGFEMAEVKPFDTIPDKMRFPMILPVLFEKVRSLV